MADFNALEALINAHIKKNGVQAITGNILNGILRGMVSALGKGYTIAGVAVPSSDPGTMTGPLAYLAYTAGTYTHFGGLEVEQGEVAMLIYNEAVWHKEVLFSLAASATIDGNVGTPEVGVSFVDGLLTFDFRNMKGNPGDAAGFGTINATVDGNVGTPGVSVQSSGPDTAKNITFQFTNLKGETGVTSVVATVDNTVGTPTCTVSLVGQQLTLAFSGLKGAQGDTGSSVDYPFTIVNNLTTNDPTQALSAAMGVQLEAEVSQLEAEVDGEQNTQEITIPTTSGSPVPTQTKYDVVLAVGRAYSVHWDKGTSGITSQPFIYFYDSDGNRVTAYTKNGSASITYEPLSLNSDDVFVFQSAVAKVALYVAGTSVPNTGEAELSISYRGVGLVSKVAGLEEKTEDLEDSVDGLSQSISVLDVEVNGIPGFDAEQSVNATSGTGIPSSTRYPMELTANTRYLVTFEGLSGIVSSIALYLRDADGIVTTNFYNLDDTPASESFDSSLSSKYIVPQSNTTLIAFYSSAAQVVGTGTIKCKVTKEGVAGLTDDIAELAEDIDGIEENIDGIEEKNNTYDAVIKATDVTSSATRTTEKYAKYENGAIVVAGIPTAMEILQVSVVGVSVVRAYATAQDNVPAIIAFYAGTPSNSTYIKDASVQASAPYNSGRWFEAEVPTNAKFVVVSNRYAVVSSPKIELLTIPAVSVVADEVSKKPNFSVSPFWKSLFYSHFNPISLMMDGHGRKLIAGESLADIRVASRLGFDIIEANLHETSDGVIICTHGDNGFGPAFIDLSTGVMPSGDISSFSYDYVLQNIRYNSDLDKYKTPPPTLDQFLACCKANGIGAMVGVTMLSAQGAIDAINKARSILNDKIIVYTGTSANNQRAYFPGYFLRWFSGSSVTYQGIVDDMNAVGSPAICGLNSAAISALKTAGKYDDLIGFLHANGFLYAVAYLTEEEERDAIADGCDLIASNHEVNFFEGNGLAVDINDDVPQFVLSNATLSDGVITMSNGGTITIGTTDKVGLGKGMLKLRFDGSLTVDFGSIGVRSISSDGTEDIVISDYFLVRKERVVITATSATSVYDLVYTTSRV